MLDIDRTYSRSILNMYETYISAIVEKRFLVDFDKTGRACSFAIWCEEPNRIVIEDLYSATGDYLRLYRKLREQFSDQPDYKFVSGGNSYSGKEQRLW
ncbi:hypothetical protein [uncultured Roseibium sp.]|uniref:hypothetical protein n=1 Tax=uncultured Roseibium sp. TaxID=1936171 RepID=UPI00261C9B85|nr:hypothetical protein [uncultured Roseibium sp.]